MKKIFCDKCGNEMQAVPEYVTSRIRKGMSTVLFVTRPDKPHEFDFCRDCIIASVVVEDTRPKAGPVDSHRLHEIIDACEKAGETTAYLIQNLRNEFP